MAEKSSFFNAVINNGIPDRTYKAEEYASYFGSFISDGVFPNPNTNLEVSSFDGMNIKIKAGKAWINGYYYNNDSDLILKVDPADGVLKRIDRVVVRLDHVNREITCKIKKGTFASTPVAPILQRDVDAYELGIADILVDNGVVSISQSNITDTRLKNELCGIVTSLIDIDIELITDRLSYDFDVWFETVQGILDGDVAGNLANRIVALEDKVGNGLTADNILMNDGSTVETSILNIQNEVNGARLKLINSANSIVDKLV